MNAKDANADKVATLSMGDNRQAKMPVRSGTVGAAGCFFLQAAGFIWAYLMTSALRLPPRPESARQGTPLQSLLDGFGYIRSQPEVFALLGLAAIPTVFGMPYIQMLPVMARNVLGTGPGFTDRLSAKIRDRAGLAYTVSATIQQLEKPTHPEAYGLILGGRNLDGPDQTYTYFVVRGTGELLVKVREGGDTRDVIKWTANADLPKEDASGKASYAMSASVEGDAVKFSVNGKQVASVSKAGLPTDGIAGLRINHNLHVNSTPVSIQRP